jgi:circadian clock protein KaiC
MLRGGLPKGRVVLVSGPSGSGKTTLCVQFLSYGACNNERGLFVTLEESKKKICEDMLQFGFDLEQYIKEGRCLILGGPLSKITSYMGKIDGSVDDIIREIEGIIRAQKISRVVIDSVNLFSLMVTKDSDRRQALAALCNTLSALGVTALLVVETPEDSYALSTYGIEEFIADGVIIFYRIRHSARVTSGIAVRKLRGSDHDRDTRSYKISGHGVVVYPDQPIFSE